MNFFIYLTISMSAKGQGSQIQQESDVPEIAVVTLHTSPGHSGKGDRKTEKG